MGQVLTPNQSSTCDGSIITPVPVSKPNRSDSRSTPTIEDQNEDIMMLDMAIVSIVMVSSIMVNKDPGQSTTTHEPHTFVGNWVPHCGFYYYRGARLVRSISSDRTG